MRRHTALFILLACCSSGADVALAEEPKAGPPVEFPKLDHFKPLWERSVFTTKALPAPDVPSGPNFADNFTLLGTYEIDGALVAVLSDRTTSQVTEARIGSENELGIKIRKITPGETQDKMRIQLQKGDQAGWVGMADEASQPPEVVQRAVIPTQQAGGAQPQLGGQAPNPMQAAPERRMVSPAPQPAAVIPAVNPILPPPSAGRQRTPGMVNDVPLPPP